MNNEEKIINENSEIASLFEKLDTFAKSKPDVFAFFCKKYEQILYDNFDWAYALFHSDEKPAGSLDKFMPYITVALSLITLVVVFIKLK